MKWVESIIYADVLSKPLNYSSSPLGYGVIGILALGALSLPDVGDSRDVSISSGSVARCFSSCIQIVQRTRHLISHKDLVNIKAASIKGMLHPRETKSCYN